MGIFVYAFTGTGKSTTAKKYSNVIDLESTLFKYENTFSEDEGLKGTKRKLNPLWPQNYFEALEKEKNNYDYILISDNICGEWLVSRGYEYWQVYPNISLKDEYVKRFRERGNNESFIEYQMSVWETWINGCMEDTNASNHIELKSGEYLADVIPNLKRY